MRRVRFLIIFFSFIFQTCYFPLAEAQYLEKKTLFQNDFERDAFSMTASLNQLKPKKIYAVMELEGNRVYEGADFSLKKNEFLPYELKKFLPYQFIEITEKEFLEKKENFRELRPVFSDLNNNTKPPKEEMLVKKKRSLLYPTLYCLGFMVLTVGGAFIFYDAEQLNWESPSFDQFFHKNILALEYRWDPDRFAFNYIAHPLVGSEYYLRARAEGYDWFESFLFSFAMSTTWEYLFEGWVEPVSIQDMIVTPVLGSVLGEGRYQAKKWLKKKPGVWAKIGVVAVDPLQALVESVYGLFSDEEDVTSLPQVSFHVWYQNANGVRIGF
jgi:hypothetical protein